jgi:hypothetical protein
MTTSVKEDVIGVKQILNAALEKSCHRLTIRKALRSKSYRFPFCKETTGYGRFVSIRIDAEKNIETLVCYFHACQPAGYISRHVKRNELRALQQDMFSGASDSMGWTKSVNLHLKLTAQAANMVLKIHSYLYTN